MGLLLLVAAPPVAARDSDPPVLRSGHIDGRTLTLTFSEAVTSSDATDLKWAFWVDGILDGGGSVSTSAIAIAGATVTLTLGTGAEKGQTVTVNYAAPAGASRLKDGQGNAVETFSNVVVRNDTGVAPPEITSDTTITVAEGNTTVTTLTATDSDTPIDQLTWSKAGGADADQFSLTSAGVLSFVTAPNYESPADADENNVYEVTVRVSDGTTDVDAEVSVTVTNVDEPGIVTLSPPQPRVNTVLRASLHDPDGVVGRLDPSHWQWAWSPDKVTWTDIPGRAERAYESGVWIPVQGDVGSDYAPDSDKEGMYLRATATYTDGHGSAKTAEIVTAQVGAPAPAPEVSVQVLVSGLSHPWDLAFTPDGTMLFTERPGVLRSRLIDGTVQTLSADLSDLFVRRRTGLMGIAVDPDFVSNRRFYTCMAHTGLKVQVISWTIDAAYTSATRVDDPLIDLPIVSPEWPGSHHGCRLRFDPHGYLWVSVGDGWIPSAPQDLDSLGGKILRVDPLTGAGAPGNPFPPSPVYTYGHRHPQGLAWRPGTDQMWAVEHGHDWDDEINLLVAGGNYGFDPHNRGDPPNAPLKRLVKAWKSPMTDRERYPDAIEAKWSSGHLSLANSGGTFLEGTEWGAWEGRLAVATLRTESLQIFEFTQQGDFVSQVNVPELNLGWRLRSPVMGPDGALYVTTDEEAGDRIGRILRVSASRAPAFLTDTQEQAVAENTSPSAIVATVLALDPDGAPLTYTLSGPDAAAFTIPDATVGAVQAHVTLDYETKASYEVIVTATNAAGLSDSLTLTITVTNVNEPVINELMASNDNTILDPQGDADDWIELKNTGTTTLDLGGMYLSDDRADPKQWQFPTGTGIAAGGYLLVWADNDDGDSPGLHTNFELSAGGGSVVLSDTDANGNTVLDSVDFPALGRDVSYGRTPEGSGSFRTRPTATPGALNPALARPTLTAVALTSTPTIDADSDGAPETYGLGETIEVTVTWDADVVWDVSATRAAIKLDLDIGGHTKRLSMVADGPRGTGRTLVFHYVVQSEDTAPDGIFPKPFGANLVLLTRGAMLTSADGGRHARRAHAALPPDPLHKVDGGWTAPPPEPVLAAQPAITAVALTSTPSIDADSDGTPETYGLGETIEVTVTWDADVMWDVSATRAALKLDLDIGGHSRRISMVADGVQGTARSLVFHYVVQREDRAPAGVFPKPFGTDLVLLTRGATLTSADGGRKARRAYAALAPDPLHKVEGRVAPSTPANSQRARATAAGAAVRGEQRVDDAPTLAFLAGTAHERRVEPHRPAGFPIGPPVVATGAVPLEWALDEPAGLFAIDTDTGQMHMAVDGAAVFEILADGSFRRHDALAPDFRFSLVFDVPVTVTDAGGRTIETAVAIRVTVDTLGDVALSTYEPQVGTPITARLADPDGVLPESVRWQWEYDDGQWREDAAGWLGPDWQVVAGATTATFTPSADMAGSAVRAVVSYADGLSGPGEPVKRAASAATDAIP